MNKVRGDDVAKFRTTKIHPTKRQVELLDPHLNAICHMIHGAEDVVEINVFDFIGQDWQEQTAPKTFDFYEDEELEALSMIPDIVEEFLTDAIYDALDKAKNYFASLQKK